jgi:hypothetical protein
MLKSISVDSKYTMDLLSSAINDVLQKLHINGSEFISFSTSFDTDTKKRCAIIIYKEAPFKLVIREEENGSEC